MDTHRDRQAADVPPAVPTEAELRAAMEQSDRDVEAGLTVALNEVLSDIDGSLARIEARRRARRV